MDFLAGVDEQRVREAFLAGLVALHKRHPRRAFEYGDVVAEVAKALVPNTAPEALADWVSTQQHLKAGPGPGAEDYPDNRKLHAAVWSLIGQGLAFPRLQNANDVVTVKRLSLTAKGELIVDRLDHHPRHPGFIRRFRESAPTATDEVVAHLEDAVACLEAGLLRPALMMLGVVNERTIAITHAALVHEQKLSPPGARPPARTLLGEIEKVVRAWKQGGGKAEDQHRLTMAIAAAETIRVERNEAAHPSKRVDDVGQVESMAMSAASMLPVLWELVVKVAVDNGFSP